MAMRVRRADNVARTRLVRARVRAQETCWIVLDNDWDRQSSVPGFDAKQVKSTETPDFPAAATACLGVHRRCPLCDAANALDSSGGFEVASRRG